MQSSKFQEHHGDATFSQLVEAANRANENIHVGFKVVFEYDEYSQCEMFHLMELVEYKFFSFTFCFWRKVIKTDRVFTRSYFRNHGGEFESTHNTPAIKRRIPDILERRRVEALKVMQKCVA